jgi:hypothetical protein
MVGPIISPDGTSEWNGTKWVPLTKDTRQDASVSVQDSVISGDVNISMNNLDQIKEAFSQVMNNQQPQHASYVAAKVVAPTKQIWFLGRRIWEPKGFLLSVSFVLSLLTTIAYDSLLGGLLGLLLAGYCVKNGDIRGIPVFLVILLMILISG